MLLSSFVDTTIFLQLTDKNDKMHFKHQLQKKSLDKSRLLILVFRGVYSKTKLTLTFTTNSISPVANVSLGDPPPPSAMAIAFISYMGLGG